MTTSMRRQGGFSLVELMVSVVIGMLALVFATKMLVSSERTKQTSIGSSDSMQSGMQAMFSISQDAAQAGWGMNDPMMGGCDTKYYDKRNFVLPTIARSDSPTPIAPLGAVVIKANGNKPDEISLMAGSANSGTGSVGLSVAAPASATKLSVDRMAFAFRRGDAIAIVPEAGNGINIRCAIAQLSEDPVMESNVQVLKMDAGNDSPLNSGSGVGQAYLPNVTRIFNLGPAASLSLHTWKVSGSYLQLRSTNMSGAEKDAQAVVGNIVSIKAQYGFDTSTGVDFKPEQGLNVSKWSSAMYDADGDGITGGQGDYARIGSLRLAVVARSKAPVAPPECQAHPSPAVVVFADKHAATVAPVPITLDVAIAADTVAWECYRYRVFETIVPLRNLTWRPTAS